MKHFWLHKNNSDELIIFFNGWSMDERPFSHLEAQRNDVLMLFDYSDLELEFSWQDLIKRYKNIKIIAWSLGIYVAAHLLSKRENFWEYALAVNGTLAPISDQYGIPSPIFEGTATNWDENNRKRFVRRECSSLYVDFFNDNAPQRSAAEQKEELIALQKLILSNGTAPNIFNAAVVGTKDKIFPPKNQLAAWQQSQVMVKELAEPHYFWPKFKSWEEVVSVAKS